MSATAYIATRKVRHLAVWAAAPPSNQNRRYTVGHLSAICGQPRGDDFLVLGTEPVPDGTYSDPADDRRDQRGHTRPICTRCLSILDDLCYLDRGGR